jgi:hypothetical protein
VCVPNAPTDAHADAHADPCPDPEPNPSPDARTDRVADVHANPCPDPSSNPSSDSPTDPADARAFAHVRRKRQRRSVPVPLQSRHPFLQRVHFCGRHTTVVLHRQLEQLRPRHKLV